MVDLDPQGNATMGSGVDKRQLELSVYDVLLESATIAEAAVRRTQVRATGCSGANRELAGAEVELVTLERRDRRLKAALAAADCRLRLRARSTARRRLSHAHPQRADLRAWRDRADAVRVLRARRPRPIWSTPSSRCTPTSTATCNSSACCA